MIKNNICYNDIGDHVYYCDHWYFDFKYDMFVCKRCLITFVKYNDIWIDVKQGDLIIN